MKSAVLVGALGGVALAMATHDPAQVPLLSRQSAPPRVEAPQQKPILPKPTLLVPFFGNPKCPIDANAVDHALFLAAEGQRVYACCAGCKDALEVDAPKSLTQAYPEAKPLATRVCVVCASDLPEEKSRKLDFQGRGVKVCSPECEKEFRAHPGVWLARLTWPDAKDANNVLCPVDDKSIDGVTVVIWKGTLVRLCAFGCVAPFEKNPEPAVTKAKGGS